MNKNTTKLRRSRTPEYYRAPLRSRAAMIGYLTHAANSRPSYGVFAFNVKLYRLDLDFLHLTTLAKESGELPANVSQRYLDACLEVYNEKGAEALCDWAIDQARSGVTDGDTNRMLWDGDKAIAEWEFHGRSGGWLVLTQFENLTLSGPHDDVATVEDLPYDQLRRLYRFIVQCKHDFRLEAIESEVEYQAAFILFENLCSDVETDAQCAERMKAEAAEADERAHWEARDTVTR